MAYKVSNGYYNEKGYFAVSNRLKEVDDAFMEEVFAKLDNYLLKIELRNVSTYDNSDDDRADSSYNSYSYVRYKDIDARNNTEHLLYYDGEIKGVAFTITRGRDVSKYAFFFDGSISQTITIGYSASHSSDYTYVQKVTLVQKGVDGAPVEANKVRFEQHEMYPSF